MPARAPNSVKSKQLPNSGAKQAEPLQAEKLSPAALPSRAAQVPQRATKAQAGTA
jgi:hypothetical protein